MSGGKNALGAHFFPDFYHEIAYCLGVKRDDRSTGAAFCAQCEAPLEPDAICLACAFADALSSGGGASENGVDSETKGGFGDFAPPDAGTFGKYRLNKELGAGGMGVIWEAEDTSLKRTVAIKMIRGFAFSSAGERQRFQREATAVAQLDHPNIVPVYEVGEIEGRPYFAMKRLGGGTLSSRLENGAMDQREAAAIMEKLARAIAHAHGRGVLHRDLKPDNVLFDDLGEPHVTDFGLAKMLDDGDGFTLSIAHVGTPHYMSPEQARGCVREITTASDVWGAGALLFQMLTGQTPFSGESTGEILHNVANEKLRFTDEAVSNMDKDLRTLCSRCLDKNPGRRVPGAEVLANELALWLDGQPIVTKPVSPASKAWHGVCQRPFRSVAIVIALLFIALAAAGSRIKRTGEQILKYGDTISLRNLSSDEYLDTCGYVFDSELGATLPTQSLFVFTSKKLNRGGRPTGTWLIEPTDGSEPGKPLSFGDKIHLKCVYPDGGSLDNCGLLEHLSVYNDFAADHQAAVSTSMGQGETDGTDTWIVRSPVGKTGPLKVGDAIVLETAFADGGHLNASGEASRIKAFSRTGFEDISTLVFVSNEENTAELSGQWKVERLN